MRLSQFILNEKEAILAEWESFAATLTPAAQGMSSLELRDHAGRILEAVTKDLSKPQTRQAQFDKSRGLAPALEHAPETAAQTHAVLRARHGFDINQLCAEYRALRAVVLRLWLDGGDAEPAELEDVIRFNEAIDQALTESVSFFSSQVDRSRDLLLGMLGHDMRSPLQTIQMTALHLAKLNDGQDIGAAAARLIRSGARMQGLLDDMLDFSRTKLGLGIRVSPACVDVAALVSDELDQLRIAHGKHTIELDVTGDTRAPCDGRRIQQLLGNLVGNAIKYGEPTAAVRVMITGCEREISLAVRNRGPAIPPSCAACLNLLSVVSVQKRGRDRRTAWVWASTLHEKLPVPPAVKWTHALTNRKPYSPFDFLVALPVCLNRLITPTPGKVVI
jgi:hypothetical protein